jgi:hypothetical protein
MLQLVSMMELDAVSLGATGVASWRAESSCEMREVSRPEVTHGHRHGSRDGLLLDAAVGPQRRLRSTSGLPARHGTAMGLGCYEEAILRPRGGVVVRGARGLTFTENGPFTGRQSAVPREASSPPRPCGQPQHNGSRSPPRRHRLSTGW